MKKIERIRKKLEKEYDKNYSKIEKLCEKSNILSANDFESRFLRTLLLSLYPYSALILLIGVNMIPLVGISVELIPLICVSSSFIIGSCIEKVFSRKRKKQLKEISNSKIERDKIEEKIRYQIEIEKLKNYNKILEKMSNDFLSNENMIHLFSPNLDMSEKDKNNQTKEVILDNVNNIEKELKLQQEKMNITTTKSVLSNEFYNIRDNFFIRFNKVEHIIIFGFIFTLFNLIPTIILPQFHVTHFTILSLLTGGFLGNVYDTIKNKNRKFIFQRINKELGENALFEFVENDEKKQFQETLDNLIKDICAIRLKLEFEKQKLYEISEKSNNEVSYDYELLYSPQVDLENEKGPKLIKRMKF